MVMRMGVFSSCQKIGIVVVLSLLLHCAGSKPSFEYTDEIPEEIQKLIKQLYVDAVYSVGTASDRNEGVAIRKATLQARAELVRQFQTQIDVLQKSYEESINDKTVEDYQQAIEAFATLEVSGSKAVKSLIRKDEEGLYTAKVLVVVSAERLKTIVEDKLQNYTSFKASKAYQELEERVAREKKRERDEQSFE